MTAHDRATAAVEAALLDAALSHEDRARKLVRAIEEAGVVLSEPQTVGDAFATYARDILAVEDKFPGQVRQLLGRDLCDRLGAALTERHASAAESSERRMLLTESALIASVMVGVGGEADTVPTPEQIDRVVQLAWSSHERLTEAACEQLLIAVHEDGAS